MICKDLNEVRSNIDRLDNEIVKLISEREGYVKQASNFKKDTDGVKAPKRVEEVIEKVRNLADYHGGNKDLVEAIYREMIKGFINLELQEFNKD